MIYALIFILLAGLFLVSLILPWVNRSDLNSLHKDVQLLRNQLASVLKLVQERTAVSEDKPEVTPEVSASVPVSIIPITEIKSKELPPKRVSIEKFTAPLSSQTTMSEQEEAPVKVKSKIDFEQQFGARLPVWVGGIALALAGFFLVKYSIEAGYLTEKVRVTIGLIFGIGLIFVANYIRNKTELANGKSIAQALSGAGIADLYLCVFAATNLYHFFPSLIGFILMALVTAAAVLLSLRHGMPIALLGLIGGLLTPALIHSQSPNAFLLFLYLYMVLFGLFIIIRKQQWWSLAFPAVLGAIIWVIFWIFFCYVPGDGIWLGLFLIAVSTTYIITSRTQFETIANGDNKKFKFSSMLNYLTLGSAALLMGLIGFKGGYGFPEWSLFGLLAAGGIAMAYFNQKLYSFVPWLLMIVNAVMLLSWNNFEINLFLITIIVFAMLYTCSGYLCMWRAVNPVNWGALIGATSVLYFLIAYYQLHKISLFSISYTHSWLWGCISLLLSLAAAVIVWQILDQFKQDKKIKQHLLTIFVLTTIAFLSLGLMIILKEYMLAVAFATQILTISWINTKVDIVALRPITGLLTICFFILLLPQLLSFLALMLNSLTIQGINTQTLPIIAATPLLQLGVPAVMFGYASWLLREQQDDKLVKYYEMISMLLICLMGYCLIRNVFHVSNNWFAIVASFTERGAVTNIFCFLSLVSVLISRQFNRPMLLFCGLVLFYIVIFRIIYFDLFWLNPLWSHQYVGNLPIINALILPFGITIAWFMTANQQLSTLNKGMFIKASSIFCFILLFTLITLNVRQFYQGGYLDGHLASNAEIYTYSIVWLLMGISLLLAGTLRHNKMLRIASLVITILTVGKVFLYDASALTGFYRVFSFLLLGMILIGLSWFYTRFVFIEHKPA